MGANGLDRRAVASAACRVGQPVKSPPKKCERSSTRCVSSKFPFLFPVAGMGTKTNRAEEKGIPEPFPQKEVGIALFLPAPSGEEGRNKRWG
jgi:hypothetical protein